MKILFLFGLLLVSLSGNAQTSAEAVLHPLFSSHKMRGIYLQAVTVSDRDLVAVGEYGMLVRCTLAETLACIEHTAPGGQQLTTVVLAYGRIWTAGQDAEVFSVDAAALRWQSKFADPALRGEVVLDLQLSPTGTLWAVGTNGLVLRSTDRGESWQVLRVADLTGFRPHLFGVWVDAHSLYIVGEKGAAFRIAADALVGEGELRVAPQAIAYDGSLFGVERAGDGRLVLYGMNGNAFVETGDGFARFRVGAGKSLIGAAATQQGALYLVGLGGAFARYREGALEACILTTPAQLTDVAVLGGRVIASGLGGLYELRADSRHCR